MSPNLLGENHIYSAREIICRCRSVAYAPHAYPIYLLLVLGKPFALIFGGNKTENPKQTYRRSKCFPSFTIARRVSP
jgi:hypothetical protein